MYKATIGSLLQTSDGRVVDVDGVERRTGEFQVYNFNVEGFHTYYVSDLGVLVHNTSGPTPTDDMWDDLKEFDKLDRSYSPPPDIQRIASGHAWADHRSDFSELNSPEELARHLHDIENNPTAVKTLNPDAQGQPRTAYYDENSGTIFIKHPNGPDGGTAYRPAAIGRDPQVVFDDLQ